ncbi:MAG: hypothetical protein IPI12_13335 [Ignavibacteriales bacterium]|nr:hypothetical protein [Ignavibacteriales bacterium]
MFGYDLKSYDNFVIRIAEPEKAILDFLYLNPRFDSTDEIHELRINQDEFRDLINMEKIEAYLRFIDSKSLCQRFKLLNDWISNA